MSSSAPHAAPSSARSLLMFSDIAPQKCFGICDQSVIVPALNSLHLILDILIVLQESLMLF
jgi:hypothetical protein